VLQGHHVVLAQIVAAVRPGIAQHAPAAGTHEEWRRAWAIALFPAARIGHVKLAALELEAAILLAATEEAFRLVAGKSLHTGLVAQFQRLHFAPQRQGFTSTEQGETYRVAVNAQGQSGGAQQNVVRLLAYAMLNTSSRLADHDGGSLVAGICEFAFRAGPDTQYIVLQQADTHDGAGFGCQVPGLSVWPGGRCGSDAAQLPKRGGQCGASGQSHDGSGDCSTGESLHKPA
jgi:hypothetical protein